MADDLLERARSAVTAEEECDVIRDAVWQTTPGEVGMQKIRMLDAVRDVRAGCLPRPALLGVVAALVPEGARYTVDSDSGVILRRHGKGYIVPLTDGAAPALRITIAILEAGNP